MQAASKAVGWASKDAAVNAQREREKEKALSKTAFQALQLSKTAILR